MSITPESQSVAVGDKFNVTIMINIPSSVGVEGLQFVIEWNSTIMTADKIWESLFHSVTPQSEWDNIWSIQLGYNNTAGFASYAQTFQDRDRALEGGYAPIGPGMYVVAIIEFKGAGDGRSTIDFVADSIRVGDINGMPLSATSTKGSVTVGNVRPLIEIISPQNGGYSTIPVNLTLRITGNTSWIGYSIDDQANVTFTNNLIQVSEGQHNLEVFANNTAGQMASSNITTFIADQTSPTIDMAVSPSASGDALEFVFGSYKWKFNFSASGSHAHLSNISAYFWDFGDGTNATAATVTHEYRQPGTYNVTLEVTDLAGNTAGQTTPITINPAPAPLPSFGLVVAVVIPVVWALALAFYVIRFRRKTRKV
ncbi:MAG: PKD domain-containing protein [Candidatus Bathyarchaeia archaeon]